MNKSIITAQNESIKLLTNTINSFVKGNNRTRVIPLAIPTGWGKTRIAVQAVMRASYRTAPVTVIWPQNHSHINEIWKDKINWCRNRNGACSDKIKCNAHTDNPVIYDLHKKYKRPESNFKSHSADPFNGTFYYVNNNFDGIRNKLDKSRGPVIFIIDEWHSKNILKKYNNSVENPEIFWRDFLFNQKSRRPLFIILISATPIGATSEMDNISMEENDDSFGENIENALKKFNNLTKVGNQNRDYNLYNIYPDLIEMEAKRLNREQIKFKKNHQFNTSKTEWIKNYILLSKKIFSNKKIQNENPVQIYQLESLALSGVKKDLIRNSTELKSYFKNNFLIQNETLKLRTLHGLLDKNQEKKFVIFCHYIDVARCVEYYLVKKGVKAVYIDKISGVSKETLNKFKDKNNKEVRVLILTDKFSQGISLHESDAWLIHFELSWNPIRIIQRFGRVWRINSESKKLTKPLAFYIPHSFSAEEEIIARLRRRWLILKNKSKHEDANYLNLCPITIEIALGIRCSPEVDLV